VILTTSVAIDRRQVKTSVNGDAFSALVLHLHRRGGMPLTVDVGTP
jgi:hypothetical protein